MIPPDAESAGGEGVIEAAGEGLAGIVALSGALRTLGAIIGAGVGEEDIEAFGSGHRQHLWDTDRVTG